MKVKNHIENEYAAGCARVSSGCVAYHGALQYYALQTQQFNTIYLHSDKRFRPFVIDGVAYEYHPLKFTYNVVISKDPEGNPIAVTSLSQTVVDCIRHIDLAGGLEELLYALASISYGQLKEKDMLICLEAYDNGFRDYAGVLGLAYTWIEWLEYNITRALGKCRDESERETGISEVRNTISRIRYIRETEDRIRQQLIHLSEKK